MSNIENSQEVDRNNIESYILNNPGKPLYVVKESKIILRMVYDSRKDKVLANVYVPGTDTTVDKEIEKDLLGPTGSNFQADYKFFTWEGMKLLLDDWDKV